VYPPRIVARQRLGIHFPAATNTRNKEEFLDPSDYFVVHVLSKESLLGMSVYPLNVARQWLGKHVYTATKNC
jgi:hypothetical protein